MTIVVAPGAVAANTPITLPGGERLQRIRSATLVTMSDGTAAGTVASLAVVTTTPTAGQIQLVGETQIQLGDALTTRNEVVLHVTELGAVPVANAQ